MTYSDKIRAEWEKENGTALEWAADWFLSKHTEYVNKLRGEIEKKRKNTKTEFEVGSEMSTPRIIRDNGFNQALDDILALIKE